MEYINDVSELIEILKEMPQDSAVSFYDELYPYGKLHWDITNVELDDSGTVLLLCKREMNNLSHKGCGNCVGICDNCLQNEMINKYIITDQAKESWSNSIGSLAEILKGECDENK